VVDNLQRVVRAAVVAGCELRFQVLHLNRLPTVVEPGWFRLFLVMF
jgi:hypothetical protein